MQYAITDYGAYMFNLLISTYDQLYVLLSYCALYVAKVAYIHRTLTPTICWSVCVCLSSALWQNG